MEDVWKMFLYKINQWVQEIASWILFNYHILQPTNQITRDCGEQQAIFEKTIARVIYHK